MNWDVITIHIKNWAHSFVRTNRQVLFNLEFGFTSVMRLLITLSLEPLQKALFLVSFLWNLYKADIPTIMRNSITNRVCFIHIWIHGDVGDVIDVILSLVSLSLSLSLTRSFSLLFSGVRGMLFREKFKIFFNRFSAESCCF